MNLFKEYNQKELNLLQEAGVILEDKDYTKDEIGHCEKQITSYIMSHSMNDISKVESKYDDILRTLVNYQK